MKKNVMLKIASVLMIAVLLTTCAISSTFAKYVTAEKEVASNLGTVAKWGVTISGAAENVELFKDTYVDSDEDEVVMSGATSKIAVVAPGTDSSSDAFALSIAGQPEVACAVTLGGEIKLNYWNVPENADAPEANKFYCPIVFTVGDTPVDTSACTSSAEYSKAVMDAIAVELFGEDNFDYVEEGSKYVAEYAPNHNFGTLTAGTKVEISWAWAFPDTTNAETDRMDTYLGNQAASGNAATIEISYNLGVEQISELK